MWTDQLENKWNKFQLSVSQHKIKRELNEITFSMEFRRFLFFLTFPRLCQYFLIFYVLLHLWLGCRQTKNGIEMVKPLWNCNFCIWRVHEELKYLENKFLWMSIKSMRSIDTIFSISSIAKNFSSCEIGKRPIFFCFPFRGKK